MSSLRELELQQELRQGRKKGAEMHDWTGAELDRAWQKVSSPIIGLAESFANLPDSIEAVKEAQKALGPDAPTDLATMPPQELLTFCRQLRSLWAECHEHSWDEEPVRSTAMRKILEGWWLAHDLYNRERWTVYFPTGTIFPTFLNYRALIARVLFDRWTHVGICANQKCKKYFYKPLRKSKLCKQCHAYDNKSRQQKHRDRRKQEAQIPARKSRKRAS